MSAVAHFTQGATPLAVNHQGLLVANTISFNLPPNVSLSTAVATIEATMNRIGVPATIRGTFQGTAKAFQDSLNNQPFLILAALVTIYIVLGVLYESYVHPLTILSTLPSAGVGALLALMAFKTEFSIMALIGVILLIGIVKKNAIMMIDFALEAERTARTEPLDAIYEACLLRFRPIMMTTMAAMLGALPLAIGMGDGGELRQPLGIAIVGGLILSQVLTLYSTPVIYLVYGSVPACGASVSGAAARAACPRYHAATGRINVSNSSAQTCHFEPSLQCRDQDVAQASIGARHRASLAPFRVLAARPGTVGLHPRNRAAGTQSGGAGDLSRGAAARARRRLPAVDWWRGFRSSELTSLMDAAQIYNLDIAVAIAQIVQADAQVGISGAPLLPSVTGTATAERSRTRRGFARSAALERRDDVLAIQSRAHRELHGRFLGQEPRHASCRRRNRDASRYNREVVTLTTIVTVANTYFQVLAAQDELRVARRNLAAAERILTLIKQQFAGGTASQLDLSQQEALVSTERAAIPPLEITLRQNIAALAVLVGARAGEFHRERRND